MTADPIPHPVSAEMREALQWIETVSRNHIRAAASRRDLVLVLQQIRNVATDALVYDPAPQLGGPRR